MEGYLSSADVAKVIRCSERHVRRLVKERKLVANKVGRRWLLKAEAVRQYVEGSNLNSPKEGM